MHRHNLHIKPTGWAEGTNEVHKLMDKSEHMVIGGKPEMKVKKILKNPGMCFDNYFSGDNPQEEAGERVFGLMCTTRHDHLPEVKAKFICKKLRDPESVPARYARLNEFIVMTNKYTNATIGATYTQVHVIFQSTS
eukprot:7414961-Ditylum_brightwellii.AAC.1